MIYAIACQSERPEPLAGRRLVFAGQQNRVVGAIELDLAEGKVGVVEELGVNDAAVAVITGKHGCAIGVDLERPKLKGFGGNLFLAALADRDGVEKPICATCIGDVFSAVGEQDAAIEAVAIPPLAAGEVAQAFFGEFCHSLVPFLALGCRDGRRDAGNAALPAKRAGQQAKPLP